MEGVSRGRGRRVAGAWEGVASEGGTDGCIGTTTASSSESRSEMTPAMAAGVGRPAGRGERSTMVAARALGDRAASTQRDRDDTSGSTCPTAIRPLSLASPASLNASSPPKPTRPELARQGRPRSRLLFLRPYSARRPQPLPQPRLALSHTGPPAPHPQPGPAATTLLSPEPGSRALFRAPHSLARPPSASSRPLLARLTSSTRPARPLAASLSRQGVAQRVPSQRLLACQSPNDVELPHPGLAELSSQLQKVRLLPVGPFNSASELRLTTSPAICLLHAARVPRPRRSQPAREPSTALARSPNGHAPVLLASIRRPRPAAGPAAAVHPAVGPRLAGLARPQAQGPDPRRRQRACVPLPHIVSGPERPLLPATAFLEACGALAAHGPAARLDAPRVATVTDALSLLPRSPPPRPAFL